MTRLAGAEILKLRTVRSTWILVGSALGLVALGVSLTIGLHEDGTSFTERDVADLFSTAGFVILIWLILGVLAFTGEFRHGTAAQTFIVTPRRERVLAAKLSAYALAGLLGAVLALGLAAAIALPWLAVLDVNVDLGDRDLRVVVLGVCAQAALWAALGVAVGAIVRNQVGAVVGVLVWLFVVEPLVFGLYPKVGKFLVGPASDAFAQPGPSDDALSRAAGALVSVGWLAALIVLAAVLLRRRDVT
jgi:ABC-2 type transport system permease protein